MSQLERSPECWPKIRRRAGLVFLSFSCLSMKMTLRNLCVQVRPKMRLGSIMLILRPKNRVCSGSTLVHPLLRNIREFLQQGRWWPLSFGIKSAYYAEELRRLHLKIVKKRRGKLNGSVLLLQESAPAHTSQVAMAIVKKCSFEVLPLPPYPPYVAPSDFYLFPNLKAYLRGRNFGRNGGIIDAVDEYLEDQSEGFYFEGISNLEKLWRKCIKAEGDYIEK